MTGSWTFLVPRKRVRAGGSRRLSTFFDLAIQFRRGRGLGTWVILLLRAVWPVGAEAPQLLFSIAPKNSALGRRDKYG
jgi:hypothetical protein